MTSGLKSTEDDVRYPL